MQQYNRHILTAPEPPALSAACSRSRCCFSSFSLPSLSSCSVFSRSFSGNSFFGRSFATFSSRCRPPWPWCCWLLTSSCNLAKSSLISRTCFRRSSTLWSWLESCILLLLTGLVGGFSPICGFARWIFLCHCVIVVLAWPCWCLTQSAGRQLPQPWHNLGAIRLQVCYLV